ncbi:MAG: glycosyltransferase family 4 protein [Gemmatimonadales bacterium]|nr:glycosyltransferase family 4 protein [Gemmatimonadota bacterium]MCL4214334.1 glycosyltransferase family 4 protein [Gemmatimonadales bacterium]
MPDRDTGPAPRVCHLTSAHRRSDMRIFHKMCVSLARRGFEVTLIVADGEGPGARDGVTIRDVGKAAGRLSRITRTPDRILRAALEECADLYHLHDPELLPIGLRLARRGKRVIFDSHEDVPSQILHKPYLPPWSARLLSRGFARFEDFACRRLDGVVAATPFIRDKFQRVTPRVVDISNYPLRDEFASSVPWKARRAEVCYIGDISEIRGIHELCAAMARTATGVRLNLCGAFTDSATERRARTGPGWERVDAHGMVDRAGVRRVLDRSVAGLVTLHPVPNYLPSQPIKLFEYMSAGIPVIASDFPLWRSIVEESRCGILVDPLDPGAIAAAIDHLVSTPEEAERMGRNGRAAVETRYNWEREEVRLEAFYRERLAADASR